MPGQRQQRAPRNRRIATLAQPIQVPMLAMSIDHVESSNALLKANLIGTPPTDAGTNVPMQLSGIPAIFRPAHSQYPVNALLTDSEMTLAVFFSPPDIAAGEELIIGINDPAVRTSTGGFMAPGRLRLADADAATVSFTAVADGSPVVVITPGVPPFGHSIVYAPRSFITTGGGVNQALDTGPTITLTFSANVNPGDTVTYTGPQITGNADFVVNLTPVPVVAT